MEIKCQQKIFAFLSFYPILLFFLAALTFHYLFQLSLLVSANYPALNTWSVKKVVRIYLSGQSTGLDKMAATRQCLRPFATSCGCGTLIEIPQIVNKMCELQQPHLLQACQQFVIYNIVRFSSCYKAVTHNF